MPIWITQLFLLLVPHHDLVCSSAAPIGRISFDSTLKTQQLEEVT
ncbi:hypothetical protein PROFUN_09220 [Planoprotostelium fungivorum]|uniref:Uncharacterized protein n=1 Tax=Planoprotostelium fungivorum TaxID=1890364 RepID=A0A2P6NHN2_9EUKA|nr:hypothetical protein PROFUN_09220 [Planoprotostelium fungivorum]